MLLDEEDGQIVQKKIGAKASKVTVRGDDYLCANHDISQESISKSSDHMGRDNEDA